MIESSAELEIDAALEGLKDLVRKVLREEQLRDRLTKLANDESLIEWIGSSIDGTEDFWVAFVEVDRFKSVNDTFGYDAADDLLRAIGDQLRNAAQNFFGATVTPFRAHGDEFFLAGRGGHEAVEQALETVRSNIGALRIPCGTDVMRCTVSVGWATKNDYFAFNEFLTYRCSRRFRTRRRPRQNRS